MSAPRILVVEDDESLLLALADNLVDEGYEVETAASAAIARDHLATGHFQLVVLDVMLPDGDGYELCREIRGRGEATMVLMLTARTLEDDLVRGFDVGADDYITKPYRLRELLARVGALLRRLSPQRDREPFGRYVLDRHARTVMADNGERVDLTRTEHDLLAFLLGNQGVALTRQRILDEVWGEDVWVDARTVDNFVSNLKRKLGWDEEAGWRIATLRGIGYRLEVLDGPG